MIVIDIEASGLDPYRHGLLSIWAVELENPSNQFYGECYLEEGREVHPQALEVIGFTTEQIHDTSKDSARELIAKFVTWFSKIEDQTIAGHNVGYFDLRYLEMVSTKYGFWRLGYRTVDLHTIAFVEAVRRGMKIPVKDSKSNLWLDMILSMIGLEPEPKPHIAINGAKLEAEAISRLLYGKRLFPEYEQNELSSAVMKI